MAINDFKILLIDTTFYLVKVVIWCGNKKEETNIVLIGG